jgi:DNA-binding beta-propeller fold protein YncE
MRVRKAAGSLVPLWVGLLCVLVMPAAPAMHAQAPPRYKVDPAWPKTLPDNWILSNIHGIFADPQDHIWVLTDPGALAAAEIGASQTPAHASCCVPSPSVMVFDANGGVVKSWGRPGFLPDWPTAEHGLWVDRDGNVWLGGNAVGAGGRGALDRQVLKLSNDGKLLLEIGHPTKDPQNNQDTAILGGPGEMTVDDAAHELYIADGFMNKRIVVFDSNTGAFKRGWGAYGIPLSQIDNSKPAPYDPATPAKQFGGPVACVRISVDGLVYVCDRTGNRIQVFTKDGKFQKEFFTRRETLDRGSAWGMTFSHDPKQKFLLVTDGEDGVVWILNRSDGSIAGQFGHKGHSAGELDAVQAITTDSHGNVYVAEVAPNHRVQKFLLQK